MSNLLSLDYVILLTSRQSEVVRILAPSFLDQWETAYSADPIALAQLLDLRNNADLRRWKASSPSVFPNLTVSQINGQMFLSSPVPMAAVLPHGQAKHNSKTDIFVLPNAYEVGQAMERASNPRHVLTPALDFAHAAFKAPVIAQHRDDGWFFASGIIAKQHIKAIHQKYAILTTKRCDNGQGSVT